MAAFDLVATGTSGSLDLVLFSPTTFYAVEDTIQQNLSGTIGSFSFVPEPPTSLLLIAAAGLVLVRRRWRALGVATVENSAYAAPQGPEARRKNNFLSRACDLDAPGRPSSALAMRCAPPLVARSQYKVTTFRPRPTGALARTRTPRSP